LIVNKFFKEYAVPAVSLGCIFLFLIYATQMWYCILSTPEPGWEFECANAGFVDQLEQYRDMLSKPVDAFNEWFAEWVKPV